MKSDSTTFFCDAEKCTERTTVMGQDTGSYLALVEGDWKVDRSHFKGWKHYCPAHTTPEARP